jgi:hypothetical protein
MVIFHSYVSLPEGICLLLQCAHLMKNGVNVSDDLSEKGMETYIIHSCSSHHQPGINDLTLT